VVKGVADPEALWHVPRNWWLAGGAREMKTPKIPKQSAPAPPPPPPSIDEAAKNAEEADRLRRRKGRLAGVLSNRMRAERTAGGKSLTGQ
jgi:hypothetical protein